MIYSTVGPILFVVVLCVVALGVAAMRRIGLRQNLLSLPNERSLHSAPTPHGGGLIIAVVCLIAYPTISTMVAGTFSWGYFAGACAITMVSYLDDVFHIKAAVRFVVHVAAAALLIADADTWHGLTAFAPIQFGNWSYLITGLWIVWMINSYNFMDGIDGLAGLQAVSAGLGWLALAYMLGMPALFLYAGVIAFSGVGFLFFNWPPARIFMGDVGSTFLGFTFAALPLLARNMAGRAWDLLPIAALLFVWFFVFDSVFTRIRRFLSGKNVLAPHREHLFQRLVSSGLSHRQVTVLYGCLSVLLSVSVLISVAYRQDIGLPMFPVVLLLTAILLVYCGYRGVLFTTQSDA